MNEIGKGEKQRYPINSRKERSGIMNPPPNLAAQT